MLDLTEFDLKKISVAVYQGERRRRGKTHDKSDGT
jgi:hypothetical protein